MGLLKDIKYIFQIPLEWFRRVDVRVFGDHPGTGMKFEPASDGSRAFMLDFDVLDDRYGGGGSGTVTQVDGVGPNASGNVILNALTEDDLGDTVAKQSDVQTILDDYLTSADLDGYATQSWVQSQGYLTSSDLSGYATQSWVQSQGYLTSSSLDDYATQSWVNSQGFIKSVGSNYLTTSDRMSSDTSRGISPYYHANLAYTGNLPGAVDNLYDWCGAYTSGATNVTSATLDTDIDALADAVLRESDINASGGVMGFVSLTASKWVKTNASGKLTTTDDTPLTADASKTGFVLNTAGTVSYVAGKSGTTYVTVVTGVSWSGTQIIATNSKLTFTKGLLTDVTSLSDTVISTVTY